MELQTLLLLESRTIRDALKKMDQGGKKILFVVSGKGCLLGVITDGDIRRWILSGGRLSSTVTSIYNKSPKTVTKNWRRDDVLKLMTRESVNVLPVVNEANQVIDVLMWSDFLTKEPTKVFAALDIPVFIMAGGKGTRLDPLTKIFPKPLLPYGDKSIIETIMDRFTSFGCSVFYISLNYKGELVETYFEHLPNQSDITFLRESTPTGTAGSLLAIRKNLKKSDLFVSNCDILIDANYSDIYDFHIQNDNDISIIGSVQHVSVPYGVLRIKSGGVLKNIIEKPEVDIFVNTGMYVIKKSVIDLIPSDQPFDFPSLIRLVKDTGGAVRVYPVSKESWTDIGQLTNYQNALCRLEP